MGRGPIAKDLRRHNRAVVLRHILSSGETTRGRVADECELSAASAVNVVADLIDEGLVEESGLLPSGGRPTARLAPVPTAAHVIGVEVGEHSVDAELFDLRLNALGRASVTTGSSEPDQLRTVAAIHEVVDSLLTDRPDVRPTLLGVGLGVPGVVEQSDSEDAVIYAQSAGWAPLPLSALRNPLGLTVLADNSCKTLATSEWWFGAAQGTERGVVLMVARGVGAGVITASRSAAPASVIASEWGHTKVSIGGPLCRCGERGCLEAHIGAGAIVRRWRERGGPEGISDEETLDQLILAAELGDQQARVVLDETVEILGIGIANIVNFLEVENVVLGGWAGVQLYDHIAAELDRQVKRQSLRHLGEKTQLRKSALGTESVPMGAALLHIEHLIEGRVPVQLHM